MTNQPFAINDKPVKDLTDLELAEHTKVHEAQLGQVGQELNAAIQKLQMMGAVLNVLRYEANRRSNSIQIASSLNGLSTPKPLQ